MTGTMARVMTAAMGRPWATLAGLFVLVSGASARVLAPEKSILAVLSAAHDTAAPAAVAPTQLPAHGIPKTEKEPPTFQTGGPDGESGGERAGECQTSGGCGNFNANYPAGTFYTVSDNWTTVSTCIYGGDYAYYSVTAGSMYEWSFCSSDGGNAAGVDTQLTLWDQYGTTIYCYSDDFCGYASAISWTAPFSGTVCVLASQYYCANNGTCMTLVWRCASCTPPGQDTATIYNAWWTNEVDADGDGCVYQATLNWDPDVLDCSGSLTVFESVYARVSGGNWVVMWTTPEHTITDCVSWDAQSLGVTGVDPCRGLDWKIEVYRAGQPSPDYTRDNTNDPDLNYYEMEGPDTPPPPPNDLCANAQAVTEPYPAVVSGTDVNATVDCPAELNWPTVWYKVHLPYAQNNVSVQYCGAVALHVVGLIYYDMCDDCPNYHIETGYAWNNCSAGGGYGIDMWWNAVSGPRDIYIPTCIDPPMAFTATFNVVNGGPATATIADAWWTDWVDADGDDCVSSAVLNWNPDVVGCNGTLPVFEKVYLKPYDSGDWSLLATTPEHTISNCSAADAQTVGVGFGGICYPYDWKIEVYRSGQSTPDATRDPSNDADLNDHLEEWVGCDVPYAAVITDAWWTSPVDEDGDGCMRSARLNWNPDVAGCTGDLAVVEKVYSKPAGSGTWTLRTTVDNHWISGCSTADVQYVDYAFSEICGPFDWKIEIYSCAQTPDATRDPSNDPDLNDHMEEWVGYDVADAATIADAWWSNAVDQDGDGCARSARLNWNPDLADCAGSLTVFEKVYWRPNNGNWTLVTTTSNHTITDCTAGDAQYVDYVFSNTCNRADYKIEIYRAGQSTPDYVRDPGNDADLTDHAEEHFTYDNPPSFCVGDLNCDGLVNFGDINPFVMYLSNYANWLITYPGCNPVNGDINQDGVYGQGAFGDINPFVSRMTQCGAGCPCP